MQSTFMLHNSNGAMDLEPLRTQQKNKRELAEHRESEQSG